MIEKRYLDVDELSKYLGISKWLIYKFIKNREVPFIPFGRLVRFDRMAIDKWAEKRSVRGYPRRNTRPGEIDYSLFDMPEDVLAEIRKMEFTDEPDGPPDLDGQAPDEKRAGLAQ
ncbi:MAG TPA: helix-turn-helix domain-containing protein [Elusimicrobiota bacterium]|nr:helix-turn-helix domain-containing protein [Elusimicrobiota bacterium]